jgi:Tfp pilus assembly protein PilN
MKSLPINLSAKTKFPGNLVLAFVVLFMVTTLALTLGNTFEYVENNKVIKEYQTRIKVLKEKRKQRAVLTQKRAPDKKKLERLHQDFLYLNTIVKKSSVSLPLFLSEIEKIKPDRVNINEVAFSQSLQVVTLKGQSDFVDTVSQFLMALDRSPLFDVKLSKQEIHGAGQVAFELTLSRIEKQNAKKI